MNMGNCMYSVENASVKCRKVKNEFKLLIFLTTGVHTVFWKMVELFTLNLLKISQNYN